LKIENIDDNLNLASTSYVKEKTLSGRPMRPAMSNETIISSNDKNNICISFVCIYFNDLNLDTVYDDTSVSYIQSLIGKVRVENILSNIILYSIYSYINY